MSIIHEPDSRTIDYCDKRKPTVNSSNIMARLVYECTSTKCGKKYLKIKSKNEIINIIVKNFLFPIKSRTNVVIVRGLLHIKD